MRRIELAAAAALPLHALFGALCLPAQGQTLVTVDESKIRAKLVNNSTVIGIPVDNPADRPVQAQVTLGLLDPKDTAIEHAEPSVTLAQGHSTISIPLGLLKPSLWARLHYSIAPAPGEKLSSSIAGTVSFAAIADYAFELKVSHGGTPRRGGPVTIQAQAIHPITRTVVPGVIWDAKLTVDDVALSPVRKTDGLDGFPEFTFDVPASSEHNTDDNASLWVQARKGDFVQQVTGDLPLPSRFSATIQTDKPIYQPSQTIHFRAVVLDPQNHAAPNAEVELRIDDDESDRVHTAHLTSSKFGIIHDDWTLPGSATFGSYRVAIVVGDGDETIANHTVRVSRYELPNFSVTAKPDRTAYLPGQVPHVTITGMYLFGKPVPRGKVKLVRTKDSSWNRRTGRSDSEDETVAEGEAQTDGTFSASLDVKNEQDDLAEESERERFRDLHYAAYYTDPSSRRTEQRRFDVRITRDPIHIYLISPGLGYIFASTSYADGRPASAAVGLNYRGRKLSLQTNKYGVGKAAFPSEADDDEHFAEGISAEATDAAGAKGTWEESYWSPHREHYQLETARTLYRAGEPVTIKIHTRPEDAANTALMVYAIVDQHGVSRRIATIRNHTGEVTFPFQAEFRKQVSFAVWNAADQHENQRVQTLGSLTVIFPDAADLQLKVASERNVYKPGDKANVRLQVTSQDGHPAEATIGLAVVDQAVLERARTDHDFGQRRWFACAYCQDEGERAVGGVSLNDLYALKPTDPITPELDLVAEALAGSGGFVWTEEGETLDQRPQFEMIAIQMKRIAEELDRHYARTLQNPRTSEALSAALGRAWTALQDPWGKPYQPKFTLFGANEVIQLWSAGPDKQYDTNDDFIAGTFARPYFAPAGQLIKRVLDQATEYPATAPDFLELLRDNGLLLDKMPDPWGTPYRASLGTRTTQRFIQVKSAGPDKRFGTYDDVQVAAFSGSYFRKESQAISKALQGKRPQTQEEFVSLLTAAGIDVTAYRDAWGHPYRVTAAIASRYANQVKNTTVRVFGGADALRTEVIPVTERFMTFALRSAGPDGLEGTYDDFDIFSFTMVLARESADGPVASRGQLVPGLPGRGSISGVVTDVTGAIIASAKITLIDATNTAYETEAGADGVYYFSSVPPGTYTVQASNQGFQLATVSRVPVTSGVTTKLDFSLQVGSVSQTVTVEAETVQIQTSSSSLSSLPLNARNSTQLVALAPRALVATSTPRIRDYFPETLLWLPEIETDQRGAARVPIAFADNVTTWKLAAFASTMNGLTAQAESELRTFQPFFLDFDPPQVLTEGDVVDMPVAVRNYQDRAQNVSVTFAPNDWAAVVNALKDQVPVPANSSINVSYSIRAKAIKDKATQRVSAIAGSGRDAIERSLRIHPDGQEVTQNGGDVVIGSAPFSVNIPQNAISGATRAEMRLYPNLASLLWESASALMVAPHGCAEQTISAAYANLVALHFARSAGIKDEKLEKHTLVNIRLAIDSLAAFGDGSGGIRYWGTGEADIAVTAHALAFLLEATDVTPVDKDDLQRMVKWLETKQSVDGKWEPPIKQKDLADRQTLLLTSVVLRSLTAAQNAGMKVTPNDLMRGRRQALPFANQYDEPYVQAQAILTGGDDAAIANLIPRLKSSARTEKGATYWDLSSNTPFYGWGTAGRFETTGVVISALASWRSLHPEQTDLDPLIRSGLVFLLNGRDRWGAWYSTQATLRAMRALADASGVLGGLVGKGGGVELRRNGQFARTITLPSDPKSIDPLLVDLSSLLSLGDNQLTLVASPGSQNALVRFTASHWLPWEKTTARTSPELRLSVGLDRSEVAPGDAVRCTVNAERVGFRGYGMMLAEIGLPPAAEVDRESLEKALEDGISGVDHYEVLPDRIVFYLWPKAGGVKFDFALSARTGMNAKTTTSRLYDYYNPEALAEVLPSTWVVK